MPNVINLVYNVYEMICESKLFIPQRGNLVDGAKGWKEIFEIQRRFCKNAVWIPRDVAN
jgi:hypothetical protein